MEKVEGKKKSLRIGLNFKIITVLVVLLAISLIAVSYYSYQVFKKSYVLSAVGGEMNFVDAKQQGTIRFIDQNVKLSKSLADIYDHAKIKGENFEHIITHIADNDVFEPKNHPFHDEIETNKRIIQTWQTYHAIDVVKGGQVVSSSNKNRIGNKAETKVTPLGYSNVYEKSTKFYLTFAQKTEDGSEIQVHADAMMLTVIINGEIGNMANKMGAFYLAGVGKTMDYYITDENNVMITESRVFKDAMLSQQKGSEEPHKKTISGASDKGCVDGKYETNAGLKTGCREAMGFYKGADGKEKLGASMPYYDSNWTIVVEQDVAEILAPLYSVRNAIILITAVLLVVAGIIGFLFSKTITRPISVLERNARKAAAGDLRIRIDKKLERSHDEIGGLARAFNSMIENLQELISNVVKTASLTADSADRLQKTAREVNVSAASVSDTMMSIADSSSSLSNEATLVAERTKKAEESSEVGRQSAVAINESMTTIQSTTTSNAEKVKMLSEQSKQISEIVETISQIANKTNLLSVNVAIEAARAGKAGSGFSVIAEEVQKLAESSQDASGMIGKLIKDIQDQIKVASNDMEKSVGQVQDGAGSVEAAIKAFGEIPELVSEMNKSINSVKDVIEKNAAGAQEASAAIHQVSSSIDEVSNFSEELKQSSDKLKESISKFKIDDESTNNS